MRLVGFNLTKINAEKLSESPKGDLKIDTKMDISDINEIKSSLFKSKEELISVKFEYDIIYSPDFAEINLAGLILLSMESKESKNVLNEWKDKKISEDFRVKIFNLILRKSSLKALELEEELNLPTHFKLPSIKFPDKKE